MTRFSVVVPAHNEELWLAACLRSIAAASGHVDDHVEPGRVEVIVVANRCTDSTVAIAEAAGAMVVPSDARNISKVRNAGAAAATGDILVTIDADCLMAPFSVREIDRLLDSGRFVGGGTRVRPERSSPGIVATFAVMEIVTTLARLSGGMFWCRRSDFEAVGGFDEALLVGEDVDFARRLRAHGHRTGRRLTQLRSAPITSSCRKFDRYGDWHMFSMVGQLRQIRAARKGTDTTWVDRYFFDFNS